MNQNRNESLKLILTERKRKISREIQMEDFFFGEDAALPPGYVLQQTK